MYALKVPILLLVGAWKGPHGPLDHINVALRGASDLFEIFMHHGSDGFERFFSASVMEPS